MVEIQSNPSIKGFKEEYVWTLGLYELILGVALTILGVWIYMKCNILPTAIRGDVCMITVLAGMFLFNFKINNMLLFSFVPKIIGNLLSFNKPVVHRNVIINEDRHGKRKIVRKARHN